MLNVNELPYLTRDVPGIGGRIKARPEDFAVEEIPLYEPSGEGTHVYFVIEKTQLTTMQAIQQIARAVGRQARDIGYAGQKDAQAVTRQMLSLEHIEAERLQGLELPRVKVVSVSRHTNKLKLGHLKGNRFTIKIREADVGRVGQVRESLELLARRGVPNYFGPQRFGGRGDTWQIGRAVLKRDYVEAVSLMIGRAGPDDYGDVRRARELFDSGDYVKAAEAWCYPFTQERRVCWALANSHGNFNKAFKAIEPQIRRFFISAYQSQLFNQVVAQRLDSLDRLLEGDLAWRHPQGAVFRVEDVAREQPRCDAFEISPTGPLFGYRMTDPSGAPGEMEAAVLAAEGLPPEVWKDAERIKGMRRPLRFQPKDASADAGQDEHGDFLQVSFFLESGCYATTVLREICKVSPGQMDAQAADAHDED